MATAYSTLLGLALPVTGELSGTWGDTVNNSITSLLDSAIAGTTTLSTDADVTLTNLDGTADTSRQAILLCTGARTAIRTITAPALSKIYTVINSTTGSPSAFSVKIVAAGPTAGVTIIAGEAAMIAWNGSDFVKVSNTGGSFTTQDLTVTGNTILGDAITDTTTLNAQTRFLSRAILGYANMTGPAGVGSLSTTAPAFLYSGATTYTVTDTSGGTQTHAPIISLGQATITNATTNTIYTNAPTLYIGGAPSASTNVTFTRPYALYLDSGTTASATPVTYTNAATLYIAGAPTAGSNVTLTNPYALYIAAGTSYFDGNVGIGNTSPASYNSAADNLVIGTSGNNGMTIVSGSTSSGYIMFADGTTGQQQYEGQITYDHTSNFMAFNTSGTERMRISSTGLTVTLGATIQGLTVGLGNASASATSTAVGISALASSTGVDATAFGYFAGENLSSGAYSIAIGTRAMGGATGGPNTGSYNTAIGNSSLSQNTSGNRNIAIGNEAMTANQGGASNVAVGSYQGGGGDAVLGLNVSGNNNTAVGAAALAKTTASNNTAIGYSAGYSNVSGVNTFVGSYSGFYATGSGNTGVGLQSLGFNSVTSTTTGSSNTAVGDSALTKLQSGSYNTALGVDALQANTTASQNTAVGYTASFKNTSGTSNVAVGNSALYQNTTSSNNTAIGANALANITGSSNTGVGQGVMYNTSSGSYNTGVGDSALGNVTGSNNTAVGYQALTANAVSGTGNVAMGYRAGYTSTSADYNVLLGAYAGYLNTTGANNTYIGGAAGPNVTANATGSNNTGIGREAFVSLTSGTNNTAVGYQAGYTNTTSSFNTFFGAQAGYLFTNASNGFNTFLGRQSGYNTTGTNNTFIGDGSAYLVTTGSKNTVVGMFTGNQGGLDIRTASNNIVLSDGDGNPKLQINSANETKIGLGGTTTTQDGVLILNGSTASGRGAAVIYYSNGSNVCGIGTFGQLISGTSTNLTGQTGGSGGVQLTSGATAWASASDPRLKNITGTYTNALADINQIQPIKFTWKSDESNKPCVGVDASTVVGVVPEAIDESESIKNDETKYLHIRYTELIPLMIASIKELKAEVDSLKSQLNGASA